MTGADTRRIRRRARQWHAMRIADPAAWIEQLARDAGVATPVDHAALSDIPIIGAGWRMRADWRREGYRMAGYYRPRILEAICAVRAYRQLKRATS